MPAPASSGNSGRRAKRVTWWQYVLSIGLLVGLVAALVLLVRVAAEGLTRLPQGTSAAIITASATVLVAVVTVIISRYFERRGARERAQQEKRIPVYEEFVTGLLDLIGATRPPNKRTGDMTPEQVYPVFARFTERLVVWGSDEVIREWVDCRTAFTKANTPEESIANLYRLEGLFLAIRRDLGLSNKELRRGDLLRLWINDLD